MLSILFISYACRESEHYNDSNSFPFAKDSITTLLKRYKNKKDTSRLSYLKQAQQLAKTSHSDSLWFVITHKLSNYHYSKQNYHDFKDESQYLYNKAKALKDSNYIGLGHYKLGSYYLKSFVYDSAYYHFNEAQLIYKKTEDSLDIAANLLNMAIIQTQISDYYGSEKTAMEALHFLTPKTKKGKRYLLSLYNNLGIISNELGQYSDASYWYDKALILSTNDKQARTLENNIGIVYRNQGDYQKATQQFQKVIAPETLKTAPLIYAMALDNLGYTQFLNKKLQAADKLYGAYALRTKGKSIRGQVVSELHIADYYLKRGIKDSANLYLTKAYRNAKTINDVKNTLKALDLLYQLSNNSHFLKKRIKIKDSLILAERTLKHELVKIKYRTNLQKTQNAKLTLENQSHKNQKLLFAATSLLLLVTFGLTFLYFKQRQKTEKQLSIIEKLKARADEQDQLALYLHDDIASDIVVGLQKAEKLQSEAFDNKWNIVLTLFKDAYGKMRTRSQELSLQHFSVIPFSKKLKALFIKMGLAMETELNYAGLDDILWQDIPAHIQVNIYSIIREAIINIQKHAEASEVLLVFRQNANSLIIKIQDNGIGFTDHTNNKGIGLLNIKKRIIDMNGTLEIDHSDSKGTLLIVKLPKLWK
ncbi:tetratricopeptide repeat-containing sensor histidine kinase [uncultured Lacinutrix sp.]|uniref:tetratricopeptide repeat-containing sensor histidine kinase n=1 Tax=uncultured Lacinutrix sp. TaxID=574032 RepID=UPI0026345D2E|nr:tetratricopeptide repeat-containing sensor histidine kinase [uncultured Lacinutrix sp.]